MIFRDKKEYSVLVKAEAYILITQIVVSILKNFFCETWVGIWKVKSRLGMVFTGNSFCNFYIIISWLNNMSLFF